MCYRKKSNDRDNCHKLARHNAAKYRIPICCERHLTYQCNMSSLWVVCTEQLEHNIHTREKVNASVKPAWAICSLNWSDNLLSGNCMNGKLQIIKSRLHKKIMVIIQKEDVCYILWRSQYPWHQRHKWNELSSYFRTYTEYHNTVNSIPAS